MTDQTPAQQLRVAAQALEDAANGTTYEIRHDQYWQDLPAEETWQRGITNAVGGRAGAFCALMSPDVAKTLAAWLRREAAIWDEMETLKAELHPKGFKLSWPVSTHAEALAVARAILGSPQ